MSSAPGVLRGPSIKARLLVAASLPLPVLLVACAGIVYLAIQGNAEAELLARAELAASALAESAQYDLIQGDKAAARRSMQAVIAADPSIKQITLLDGRRNPLLAFGEVPQDEPYATVEVPMQVVDSARADAHTAASQHKGFVRVFVASPQLESGKRIQLAIWMSVLLAAGGMCGVLALQLTRQVSRPIEEAASAIQALARSEPPPRETTAVFRGELGALHAAIEQVAQQLAGSRQRQQEAIAVQTRDLQAAVSAAARSARENQRLLAYGDRMVEEERQRIALELHDTINAELVSLRLRAETIASRTAACEQPEIESMARHIVATANDLYSSTRNIVTQLRPELLETLGLSGAIEEMVRRMDNTHPDCNFEYRSSIPASDLPNNLSITAFRVAQEAISNVIKHADAKHVAVALDREAPPHRLRLVVADDGQGLKAVAGEGAGLGMIGMRERVERQGGVFSVTSGDAGTVITALL
ncbi:histidine kinase [Aquabacterium sp. A7-Y]|uniref:sensor histidine kinase n=1 Tax=Aquabacterium sp. A7-Y TaxID=1349605 RepID=UPI00223E774F|nr:histidine kinase [Aquabacterium sp. A7-Y]MCW7536751.1 histidine kinase [Aquabacterium sp. A7-Y]